MFFLTPMYAPTRVRTLALSVVLHRARDLWRTIYRLSYGAMAARLNLKGLKSPGHSVDPVIRKKVLTGGCRTPALKTDRTCFQYFRFCFVPGSEIYRSRKKHLFFVSREFFLFWVINLKR